VCVINLFVLFHTLFQLRQALERLHYFTFLRILPFLCVYKHREEIHINSEHSSKASMSDFYCILVKIDGD